MSMSPTEMQRKVRQHDNDLRSIYDILGSIQTTQQRHGNRLDELVETVDGQGIRFDAIDTRLDTLDTRLDGHDERFDGVDSRFDAVDGKLDAVLEILREGRGSDG